MKKIWEYIKRLATFDEAAYIDDYDIGIVMSYITPDEKIDFDLTPLQNIANQYQ